MSEKSRIQNTIRLFAVIFSTLCVAWLLVKTTQIVGIDFVRVKNESMLPYLKPDDLLVILKTSPCIQIPFTQKKIFCTPCDTGHAYVFQNPLHNGLYLVKFAVKKPHFTRDIIWFTHQSKNSSASFDANVSCFFEGSNTEHSIDSRHFGAISLQKIVGKVIYPTVKIPHD